MALISAYAADGDMTGVIVDALAFRRMGDMDESYDQRLPGRRKLQI